MNSTVEDLLLNLTPDEAAVMVFSFLASPEFWSTALTGLRSVADQKYQGNINLVTATDIALAYRIAFFVSQQKDLEL